MRALLHCSNDLLYHVADEENMLSGLDLLSLRRHGSRAGLPPMAALASRECCACGCLACIPVGHLERQFGWWKECKTDREKLLCLSTRILFSDATGQAVPRCWMSCFLQFGLSKHSYSAARRFIAATVEEQRLILTHGLQGQAPANKMDSEHAQLALAHFRTWTTSDPSGNSHVRPANLEVDGLPALMRHFLRQHPYLVGVVSESAYRRLANKELDANEKTLYSWKKDHNVDAKQLDLGNTMRLCEVAVKLVKDKLEKAATGTAEHGNLTAVLAEKETELKEAKDANRLYASSKSEIRQMLYMMLNVGVTLDEHKKMQDEDRAYHRVWPQAPVTAVSAHNLRATSWPPGSLSNAAARNSAANAASNAVLAELVTGR